MDRSQRSYRLHLFTVHLWQEGIAEGQVEWRGRITNTSTGAIAYFRRWQELERLLPTLIDEAIHDNRISSALFKGSVFDVEVLSSKGLDGDVHEADTVDDDRPEDDLIGSD